MLWLQLEVLDFAVSHMGRSQVSYLAFLAVKSVPWVLYLEVEGLETPPLTFLETASLVQKSQDSFPLLLGFQFQVHGIYILNMCTVGQSFIFQVLNSGPWNQLQRLHISSQGTTWGYHRRFYPILLRQSSTVKITHF